jgi:hypothetical protein
MPIARPSDTRPTYFPRERCFSRHPGVFPHLNPEAGQMSHCYPNDRGGKRVTPIDARAGKIAGAIEDLGGRTEHLAADEAGHVFLKMQHIGKLHKLDAQSLKVMETWPLDPPCGQPSSMDMDSIHNQESADKYALVQNVRTRPGPGRWRWIEKAARFTFRQQTSIRSLRLQQKIRGRELRRFRVRSRSSWSANSFSNQRTSLIPNHLGLGSISRAVRLFRARLILFLKHGIHIPML